MQRLSVALRFAKSVIQVFCKRFGVAAVKRHDVMIEKAHAFDSQHPGIAASEAHGDLVLVVHRASLFRLPQPSTIGTATACYLSKVMQVIEMRNCLDKSQTISALINFSFEERGEALRRHFGLIEMRP